MRSTIIQQIDPQDHSSIYQIFERLNTGGVNLNPMEIRQCVSHGSFMTLLKELNKLPSWRSLIGKRKIDKRLRDAELILRILALSENAKNYEKPMKGFLNKFMSDNREGLRFKKRLKNRFIQICDALDEQLPDKPFHLRGRLNYGVLDSVMVALLRTSEVPDNISKKFKDLTTDAEFLPLVTANTSDASVLEKRLKRARQKLTGG